jgi:hypothetical protein
MMSGKEQSPVQNTGNIKKPDGQVTYTNTKDGISNEETLKNTKEVEALLQKIKETEKPLREETK